MAKVFSFKHITLALMVCLLSACANKGGDPKELALRTEQQYYEAAQKAMKSNNFLLAIEQLQQLESRYPFGNYSEQVKLDLIYAYYRSLDYSAAAAQANYFIRQFPDHPEVDYAYYMRGLSAYNIDRGFIARFLPTDPSERDIEPAKQAYDYFHDFLEHFPNSEFAPDARQRIIYIRNVLADHELKVAEFYIKRKAYLAAANRGRYVVEHFQGTPAVPDALATMVMAYSNLGMKDLAEKSQQLLVSNYPDYKKLDEDGKLVFQEEIRKADRSVLNIMTFGLLGS